MPNIEDLRNNNSGPTLVNLNDQLTTNPNGTAAPSLIQGESGISYEPHKEKRLDPNIQNQYPVRKGNAVRSGMSFGKVPEKPDQSQRVAADFSSIPKVDEKAENFGIETRKSIEDDIFKPGGPFDQYKKEKMADYQADMAKLDAAIESANPNGGAPTSIEQVNNQTEDIETAAIDVGDLDTTISQATSYRAVNLKRKDIDNMPPKDNNQINYNEPSPREMAERIAQQRREATSQEMQIADTDDQMEDTTVAEDVPAITEDDDNQVDIDNLAEEFDNAEERIEDEVEQEPAKIVTPKTQQVSPKPVNTNIGNKVNKVVRSYMAIDDNIDEDDEEDTTTVTDEDGQIDELKALITAKIKPVSKKLNLDTFTIAKKGTTSNAILQTSGAAVAKWVLPNTGIIIEMREISGANMELIRSHLERRPLPDTRGAMKIIYDHIVSPKPTNYESWLKSIAFADYDNLFMAAYIASFSEANYLPIDCGNATCGKAYLTDNIDIMDMVKFNLTPEEEDLAKDDPKFKGAAEKKFWNLYDSDRVETKGLYVTQVTPISDKFAIAFREPSIYSVLIETGYFSEEFTSRYAQTINYLPYIDAIYYIDMNNRELVPIDYQTYPSNISRSARSKVQRYDKILNTLNADQHAMIAAHVNAINERVDWFSYRIPETTCPYCKHVNPASDGQSASSLLFLRNRLAVLATI